MGLDENSFNAIAKELNKRKEDLLLVKDDSGFEHWLKFPVTKVMENINPVTNWQGHKGPDLKFKDGFLELKAWSEKKGTKRFNAGAIIVDGIKKKKKDGYPPCLFICRVGFDADTIKEKLYKKANEEKIKISIPYIKQVDIGEDFWILGYVEKI